jgi:hypothetical protein
MNNRNASPAGYRADMSGPNIAALASVPRWVAWRTEPQRSTGRITKVPKDPHTLRDAASTRPETWGPRPLAEAADKRLPPSPHGPGGVGLILGEWPDGYSIGGVDLDSCRDPETGEVEPWARDVLTMLDTYSEISPSGAGIKAFFLMAPGAVHTLRQAKLLESDGFGRAFKRGNGKEHPPAIEAHLGGRYYTVTDQRLPDAPAELRQVPTDTLRKLLGSVGPAFAKGGSDHAKPDRSAGAFRLARQMRAEGKSFADYEAALDADPELAAWKRDKGEAQDGRELHRAWNRAGESAQEPQEWGAPDMTVLRLGRRAPPPLPLHVFGAAWAGWIEAAAEAAAAPPDYVAAPLLASASALIGHARWAQATPGWKEPPHLWVGTVGDSGSSKSPGADCLLRDVLPMIEQRMLGDFPDRLREWRATAETHAAAQERWKTEVRAAQKAGNPPPLPPAENAPPEPQAPRLRQSDVTVERVAVLLANVAPKGLLMVRDELSGWLLGLNSYNDAGRAFWIEAYGGRPYRVERQKHPEPIIVHRLAVAVTGTTQPDRLAQMFREADDGLLARFVWAWPDPLPFRLGQAAPAVEWAIEALDRLRLLDLAVSGQSGEQSHPIMVPLSPAALRMMEALGQAMQRRQQDAGGLMRSAYGKARGLALRLSLVLEMLRWCGNDGMTPPPVQIGEDAFAGACDLVADYFMPTAERVFGDAAAPLGERNAATLARWIVRERAQEVHVRRLQREVRLPGLNTAELIHGAAAVLVEAGWLHAAEGGGTPGRPRAAYAVNPAVVERSA